MLSLAADAEKMPIVLMRRMRFHVDFRVSIFYFYSDTNMFMMHTRGRKAEVSVCRPQVDIRKDREKNQQAAADTSTAP